MKTDNKHCFAPRDALTISRATTVTTWPALKSGMLSKIPQRR